MSEQPNLARDPTGAPLCSERRRQARVLIAIGAAWGSYALWMGPEYFPALWQAIPVMLVGAGKYSVDRLKSAGRQPPTL